MARNSLQRHDLVWLGAGAQITRPGPADRDLVSAWVALGRPLIATRRRAETPDDQVDLGLPLPPAQGKRRIALRAASAAIRRVSAPPRLGQVVPSAPAAWVAPLRALDAAARDAGLALQVFGSLAWQWLTGTAYVTATSDIDLLWRPRDLAQLQAGIALLQHWEQRFGLRADGELLLPDAGALAWRELAAGPRQVLVKSARGVRLRPLGDWSGLFDCPARPG